MLGLGASLFLLPGNKRSCARPAWRLSVCRVFSGAAFGAGRLAGNAGRGDRALAFSHGFRPAFGITLAAGEALRFRRVVARLCEQLEVPMIDHVLISEDFECRPGHASAPWSVGPMESVLVVGCRCCRVSIRVSCTRFWPTIVAHLGRQRIGEKA